MAITSLKRLCAAVAVLKLDRAESAILAALFSTENGVLQGAEYLWQPKRRNVANPLTSFSRQAISTSLKRLEKRGFISIDDNSNWRRYRTNATLAAARIELLPVPIIAAANAIAGRADAAPENGKGGGE